MSIGGKQSVDNDLRSYFDRIEAFFCRQRGAPLLLSPLDFEKVVEWFAAGVPVDVVEEGIADYFQRLASRKVPPKRAICLSFSEESVLKAQEARRVAAVGKAAGVPDAASTAERVSHFLTTRSASLLAFSADAERSRAMPVLSRFCRAAGATLEGLVARAGESLPRLETVLAPLDRELCSLILLESPPERVEEWREGARRRLGDLADSMDPESLRQTLDKLARQSALSAFGLPRLSLLYMES
jgi:hypothetical protein